MAVKMTATSIFMVPTLKIDRERLKDHNFINAYIKDINREVQYKKNAVYLLFKPDNFNAFNYFVEGEYDRTVNIVEDYDYEGGYVVLVYVLDGRYMDDFELIKQGKYSRTSREFQDLFPKVVKIIKNGLHRDEISLQHRIFKKTDDLRAYWEERMGIDLPDDMEVWEVFIEDNEVLDINQIKELV